MFGASVVKKNVCGRQRRSQEFANGGISRRSGRNSPAGSSGRASVGVWRRSYQKLGDKCACRLRHFCAISVCCCQSIDQQNIFEQRRGDMHLCPSSGYAPGWRQPAGYSLSVACRICLYVSRHYCHRHSVCPSVLRPPHSWYTPKQFKISNIRFARKLHLCAKFHGFKFTVSPQTNAFNRGSVLQPVNSELWPAVICMRSSSNFL